MLQYCVYFNFTLFYFFCFFFVLFFFFFFWVGNLGWGFITLETKRTNFGERIKAFFFLFKQKKILSCLFISFYFNGSFELSHSLSLFLCLIFLVLWFLRCVVVNENFKKSVMSFKVPKLNDSELGCIKSWWRIKIEPPRREQNESLFHIKYCVWSRTRVPVSSQWRTSALAYIKM